MEKRTRILMYVIAGLLVLNGVVYISGSSSASGFDEKRFAVADTASVTTIRLGEKVQLSRKGGVWMIGQHMADPAFTDHLLNVLLRIRVKKPVGAMDITDARKIEVNDRVFYLKANETKTRTFFVEDGQGYEMEIPGFSDYAGAIFELLPDQWRDRLLFDGSWRTIQAVSLDYTEDDARDFTIRFDGKDFFEVDQVAAIDTATMMNYLNQFQFFQANERASEGRFAYLDSLKNTDPLAVLTIDDIKTDKPVVFRIYPRMNKDPFHLWLDGAGEMVLIDEPRTRMVLRNQSDFARK